MAAVTFMKHLPQTIGIDLPVSGESFIIHKSAFPINSRNSVKPEVEHHEKTATTN